LRLCGKSQTQERDKHKEDLFHRVCFKLVLSFVLYIQKQARSLEHTISASKNKAYYQKMQIFIY
ncbi:MAG: hypothetical protein IIV89_00075, partial [Bacteroidaceae bacterium]|nr:hypothetical protein [Bacteroidaceae bacterium]